MSRAHHVRAPLAAAAALCLAGCWQAPKPTVQESERGLVWMFPGVGGGPWSLQGAYRAFRDAGVDGDIRIHEWDLPGYDILGRLQRIAENRAQAARVAGEMAAYRREHPAGRIDLVGYSAGGGIALLVAAALPDDVRLRNLILVQPAVSPTYDLTAALRHVDGRLVSFNCPSDWLTLGLGTELFGTVDRQLTAAAGKDGFELETAVPDSALRAKVFQRRWSPEMLWSGHIGNHVNILLYAWNRKYVAPYLLAE